MNKSTRNLLLADDVAALSGLYPRATPQQQARIVALADEYRALAAGKIRLRDQAGRLSRLIGKARAGGDDPAGLLDQMRTTSAELATCEQRISAVETELDAVLQGQDSHGNHAYGTTAGENRYPDKSPADGPVTITLLEDDTRAWNDYLERHPAASLYHRAEWRDLIGRTFGHRSYYCMARYGSGAVAGILPMVRLTSRLFGDFLVSMPYFNYGGALGDSSSIERALMDHAGQLASGLGVSHIEFRDDLPRSGLPVRTGKVNMVLNLPADTAALWNGFASKLRAQIRRAERTAPQVLHGGGELLDDFYQVFCRNMRDLGTPVYGRDFFRNILDTFPGLCTLIVVRHAGRPVSAGFLARSGTRLEIPWASTLREANHLSMNMLLYWETLRYACDSGCSSFDFGRSSVDSGTFRFKQQWGASPRPLYWHYWLDGERELPALNPSNPRYALFISLWKRLPVTLTRWLGPPIVRNLP